jgi:hypothetical protein
VSNEKGDVGSSLLTLFPTTVSGAVMFQKILTERDKTCYKGLSVLLLGAMIVFSVLGCRATG